MSDKSRLFVEPEARFANTAEEKAKLLDWFTAYTQGCTPDANLKACREGAEAVLADPAAPAETKRLASDVKDRLNSVEAYISSGSDCFAMNMAMLLGSKYEAMRLSAAYARWVSEKRAFHAGRAEMNRRKAIPSELRAKVLRLDAELIAAKSRKTDRSRAIVKRLRLDFPEIDERMVRTIRESAAKRT